VTFAEGAVYEGRFKVRGDCVDLWDFVKCRLCCALLSSVGVRNRGVLLAQCRCRGEVFLLNGFAVPRSISLLRKLL
jgi:hypothetical protein